MKSKQRAKDCVKYGIIDTFIIALFITVLFEIIAVPLSKLFALSGGASTSLVETCAKATRIASLSFVFMGFTVAVQGILQALGDPIRPLILSLLRLVVFVFPVAFMFTLSSTVINTVWWTFLIAEVLTCIFSFIFLQQAQKKKINKIKDKTILQANNNLIITIARQHGTNGKQIGKLVAEKLGIKFYDKELSMLEAQKRGLDKQFAEDKSEFDSYSLYLSLDAQKESIIAQSEIIRSLAESDSFVIVGRAADYVLKNYANVIKIFLYAPLKYRTNKIMEIYKDSAIEARQHIKKSDKARSRYYELVSNQKWGAKENYNLCLDCSLGNEAVADIICNYVTNLNNR